MHKLHVLIMYENSMNHVRINSAAMSNELYAIAATRTLQMSTTMTTVNDDDDIFW